MSPSVEVVCPERLQLGECPIWSARDGALYFIDIPGQRLLRHHLATARTESWAVPETPGAIGLYENGDVLVALRSGLHRFIPCSGRMTRLTAAPAYDPATHRLNDGRADQRGRFWIGSMNENRTAADAALYVYETGADALAVRETGITLSNGLAFSPDGRTLYHADTPRQTVWAYDLDLDRGRIANRRIFIDLAGDPGRPDGATVDAEGCYWVAKVRGGQIARYTPAGKLDRTIPLPVSWPTMVAFGGPDLDLLFVTSASLGPDPERLRDEPLAGQVLALRVGVSGVPEPCVR